MKKTVTIRQLFSLIDGRLATNMDDVYDLLGFITGQELATHHLPTASTWLRNKCPKWYLNATGLISQAKAELNTDDFKKLMAHPVMDTVIEIEPLDEADMDGFDKFMVENSLLKKVKR